MNITRTAFITSALILGSLLGTRLRAEGMLRGRLTDEMKNPTMRAQVILHGPQGVKRISTDQNGDYWYHGLTPGNYEITFSADGYSSQVFACLTIRSGYTLTLNITMASADYTIVNNCGRNMIDKSSSTTGVYISRDMLE